MLSRHQTGDRRPGSQPQNPGQFVKCGRGRGRDENAIPAPDRGPAPGSRSATDQGVTVGQFKNYYVFLRFHNQAKLLGVKEEKYGFKGLT